VSLTICKRCGAESEAWAGACPKCGSGEAVSVVAQPDPFLGRTVQGRFKLVRKLGQGGMGSVYEAEDLKLGMRAAVKFLNPELSQNVELARRFLSEARTYARISHPGAVTLHDFGQDTDGTLYIAMELVEGQNLKQLLDARRRLPVSEAADIALQVANVLEFTHEKGIVHRDLKPENVMVRKGLHGSHVKVLDFGIARRTYEGATRLTMQGAMAGTPRYMAPEQVRGEDVDGRADIYALGLLTFELLTGVPAVDAPDLDQVMQQQLRGGVRALGAVDPSLHHPQLDAVLDRATHRDRAKRYATMAKFAAALSAAARALPSTAPAAAPAPETPGPVVPAPATQQTWVKATPIPLVTPVPMRKQRWLTWVLLALVMGGVGAALGWLRRGPRLVPVAQAACPGLDTYAVELRELSLEELERRVLALPIFRPSDARKQLETLKVTVESYAPERRECMYRMMLLGSVTGAQTVLRTTPGLWGHSRELPRLKSLFLEMPLKRGWSVEQRAAVLEKIEALFIANGAQDEAERDYWRRQYYGIELLCEVTDEGLAELHTQRPDSCLNLEP
jgi:tRNA A-37 threonylcarbamoyl transferase component Bud32